jgi:flagellum-specific ATP synthase
MHAIVSPEHRQQSGQAREVLATYQEAEDLINIGAYKEGSNAKIDWALEKIEAVNRFLRQDMDEAVDLSATLGQLAELGL